MLTPQRVTPAIHRRRVVTPLANAAAAGEPITFMQLGTPANYSSLVENAAADSISVIRWQAPYCRACREQSPQLTRIREQWPQAQFYSMDLIRNGKAAGERMCRFFKERNVTAMPHIEVYVGSTCVEAAIEATLGAAVCVFEPEIAVCAEDEVPSGTPLRPLHELVKTMPRSSKRANMRTQASGEDTGVR